MIRGAPMSWPPGNVFKAIRKAENFRVDSKSVVTNIAEELADVLLLTSAIANRYSIDLETAFREKEELNKKRVWA